MNLDFQKLMAQATRMTRDGKLRDATIALQAALRRGAAATFGGGAAPGASPGQAHDNNNVIDVTDVVDITDRTPDHTTGRATDRTTPLGPDSSRPPAAAAAATASTAEPWRAPAGAGSGPRPGADLGHAGQVHSGHHALASGAGRDYRLYVPPQAGSRPLPLVVMLHGCTQNAADFAAGTAMDEAAQAQGFYVLYPEQSAQANPQRCWNWFKHSHQQRDRGEPALLAGMVRELMATHSVDPARVYVAGLSAGGAMAAILGEAYPDLFAAVGVHSGLAAGAATDLGGALSAMRQGSAAAAKPGASSAPGAASPAGVPTIVFHGDADATVHPSNGDHVVAATAGNAPGAGTRATAEKVQPAGKRASTRRVHRAGDGRVLAEHWLVHGAAHAWAGGTSHGSYTDPQGPDATAEMLRFFLEHPRRLGH